ncbi:MAG: hypothetical protein H6964_01085 [Chromatiaceae bacterium]|nr:hypothetical protein [Gammaproteobacteria bacterium]MCB1873499.1 hypothetical protein [Gammaproteobacteria bacterium]MCB1880053.1 hypothetical protein [Gammaproteobacteria bacterium]MCB1904350.1 hypothetical protein [Gammaproteobacteria bacterium]MCP5445572.1 hypothetical protein [Chromatiaceae bacterium]
MQPGYLYLETHNKHPGLVRCLTLDRMPSTEGGSVAGAGIRYIARFNDIDAAQMHVQNELRHALVDIDEHLYRVDVATAVAAVEADELRHERVWMDITLDNAELRSRTDDYVAKHNRQNAIWRWVGMIALGWLLLGLLGIF